MRHISARIAAAAAAVALSMLGIATANADTYGCYDYGNSGIHCNDGSGGG
jgi:hypothetical protein